MIDVVKSVTEKVNCYVERSVRCRGMSLDGKFTDVL